MGAAFGAGASGTVFGSRGSASFLTRTTTWLGIAFFAISLSMAVIAARSTTAVVSPDDLGVAARAVEQAPPATEGAAADDEFLTLPVDDESEPATDLPNDTAVENVDQAEGEADADAGEPPLS